MKLNIILSLFAIILIVLFLVFGLACSESENGDSADSKAAKICKSVEIQTRRTLTSVSDGYFQNAIFSKDNKRLYFTSSNFNGIFYYTLDEGKFYTINNETGSGYHFEVSPNNKKVYYRSEEPMVKKRRRFMLYEQDITSGERKKLLEKPARNISTPRLIKNNILIYSIDDMPKLLNLDRVEENSGYNLDVSYYSIENNQISIHRPGKEIYRISFEDRQLLWPEWTAIGERMIVYVGGVGLQLIDPSKNEAPILGNFRGAKWSPFKNMIVYMHDVDDGERVIESDIYIYNLLDKKSFNLTQTPDKIEMYPVWSPDGTMIAYHTTKGSIELMKLTINLTGE
jgi:Tol biopolymer transport system component